MIPRTALRQCAKSLDRPLSPLHHVEEDFWKAPEQFTANQKDVNVLLACETCPKIYELLLPGGRKALTNLGEIVAADEDIVASLSSLVNIRQRTIGKKGQHRMSGTPVD